MNNTTLFNIEPIPIATKNRVEMEGKGEFSLASSDTNLVTPGDTACIKLELICYPGSSIGQVSNRSSPGFERVKR